MKCRVAIIRPFFKGHFLNYFQLFLNSCRNNPEFDWLILTDNTDEYDYPQNVHKILMKYEDIKELIQSKFDFEVSIPSPAKLHDFKPAYGYIFQDYLREYDFWGQTDYDVIYGKLSKFVTDGLLQEYDKLFNKGHFSLYRNTCEVNELFMRPIDGEHIYRKVMKSDENMNFDEDWNGRPNINDIFRDSGYKVYENPNNESKIADLYAKTSGFRVSYQDRITGTVHIERKNDKLFVYEGGHLYRYSMRAGEVCKTDYMYIHLKQRRMKMAPGVSDAERYAIIPDMFEPINMEITTDTYRKIRKKKWDNHYLRLRWNNLKTKLKKLRELDKC